MFRSPLKPSSGFHGRASLGYLIEMLIYNRYKQSWCVTVCQFIPSVCLWVPFWSRLCLFFMFIVVCGNVTCLLARWCIALRFVL
jgi:hypothetical protein